MKAGFSLFLALRYLKPKRTFLSVITLISILGVTLGIMVLILVISVMTGFELELQRKVIGFDAHLVVSNGEILENWREVQAAVEKTADVQAVAPFVQGPVLVEYHGRRLAPKIRGIDPDQEMKVSDIKKFIKDGEFDLSGETAVLGSELAYALRVGVGDQITIFSPKNLDNALEQINQLEKNGANSKQLGEVKQMIIPTTLTVTGIFESGRYLYDSEFILVPLHIGQELYSLNDGIHGLTVKASDPYKAEGIKKILNNTLDPYIPSQTWIDLNKELFDAIRMERNVMFFLLFFIIIVAAFGIMNTLITVTVQKTREIGIMKALGATTAQIIGVFLGQGIVIGFFGTVSGLALGMTLIQYRNQVSNWLSNSLGITVFPKDIYQFSEIPAKIIPSDVAIICISAFLICTFAALIPAWFATRLDPVKALRYD
ncbi:MAG: ABC transporter permease [Chthoniobacterales bacterium]